jgi:adenylosuccinate synthase
MEGHEEYMKRMAKEVDQTNSAIIQKVDVLASLDTLKLNEAEQSYGDSWK